MTGFSAEQTADRKRARKALGPMAMYSAKDFIRIQIARHWYLDRNAIGSGEFTVSIHLILTADGTVTEANVLDNMSFSSSPAYRAAAMGTLADEDIEAIRLHLQRQHALGSERKGDVAN